VLTIEASTVIYCIYQIVLADILLVLL